MTSVPSRGIISRTDRLAALGLEAGAIGRGLGHEAAAIEEDLLRPLGRFPFGLQFLRRGVVVVGRPVASSFSTAAW